MLTVMVLLAGCQTAVSNRPCPRVTEFARQVQTDAMEEIKQASERGVNMPNLWQMLNAMASDRAFNRAICR